MQACPVRSGPRCVARSCPSASPAQAAAAAPLATDGGSPAPAHFTTLVRHASAGPRWCRWSRRPRRSHRRYRPCRPHRPPGAAPALLSGKQGQTRADALPRQALTLAQLTAGGTSSQQLSVCPCLCRALPVPLGLPALLEPPVLPALLGKQLQLRCVFPPVTPCSFPSCQRLALAPASTAVPAAPPIASQQPLHCARSPAHLCCRPQGPAGPAGKDGCGERAGVLCGPMLHHLGCHCCPRCPRQLRCCLDGNA